MKFRSFQIPLNSLLWMALFVSCCGLAAAQSQSAASVPAVGVPKLVQFNGTVKGSASRITGVTFALYPEQDGGAPLWIETQNVPLDASGHYQVMLGSTKAEGLPADLFASSQARWLGVQVAGQPEQPRVLFVSVPYALKAGDAETIGGLPPSAFMLAAPITSPGSTSTQPSAGPTPSLPPATVTGAGTPNFVPLWTSSTNLANSALVQTGTGATAKIGVNTTTPATTLDVKGPATVRGALSLPSLNPAKATAGVVSQPLDFVASSFSSSTNAAVNQTYQWVAEPTANNTTAPAATLNLRFGSGTTAPVETGLKVSSKGILGFAAGQTFPGTGKGTITGVTPGSGLLGGGTTGTVTLNLDSTKIPLLTGSNNFTAPQDFKANVGVGITPSATGYTPLTVGGTTTFGTWMAISNTSAGGHTWNLISAGSGNAEGAGNLGITDLTGKSTIWLEGNTNTANLTATGSIGANALVVSSTAGASIIDADGFGQNAGGPTPGLRFGGGGSGEGIASNRVIGLTKSGLDFYTNFTARMSVLQSGQIAIGTATPGAQLGVVSPSNAFPAIYAQAGTAAGGTGQNGADGIDSYGSNADITSGATSGGNGIQGFGAVGQLFGGSGGIFTGGGNNEENGAPGDGVVGISGGPTTDFGPFAGAFLGDIYVNGGISNEGVSIRMDHPLDPANKLLQHAAVESPDMKNIYDGNITTDAAGEAVVELPDYFEALNRDFRYQLTVIGQFAQAIVASKIANNQFIVHTDKPNVEVSWQVTGIRKDAWANAHRVNVEPIKPALYQGHYIHPELYGAPEEASMEWARRPQVMKRVQQMRLKQAAHQSASGSTGLAVAKP
jgi:hypothetical protein